MKNKTKSLISILLASALVTYSTSKLEGNQTLNSNQIPKVQSFYPNMNTPNAYQEGDEKIIERPNIFDKNKEENWTIENYYDPKKDRKINY